MPYTIPPLYRPGFSLLADLADDQYGAFLRAVTDAAPTANLNVFGERTGQGSGLATDVATAIIASVFSLAALRARDRSTPRELADSLVLNDFELAPEREAELRRRMTDLLDIRTVRLSVRALDLVAADQRLLSTARIVTDLRPVFPGPEVSGPDDPIEPLGALVVHLLRLEYIEAGQPGTFVVYMDAADLATLDEAIHRARQKAESLGRLTDQLALAPLSPF